MEPHNYILDLLYKFNQRTGANYEPSRGYNIMQCYVENKMEYYPKDFNKYDWLIGTICRNYTTHNSMNIITLPTILIYGSTIYAFIILDYYQAKTYDDLFNIIRYNMNLNSIQIRQLSKNPDLKNIIKELYDNRSKFVGADKIFEALDLKQKIKRKVIKKRHATEELELDFKSLKLE